MNQSNKGFSLVELIVVIAIMAILVGVAVPTYTAYIDKAEAGVEADTLGQLIYASKIANAEYGTTMSVIYESSKVTLTFAGDKAEAAVDEVMKVMADATGVTEASDGKTIEYTVKALDSVSGFDTSF